MTRLQLAVPAGKPISDLSERERARLLQRGRSLDSAVVSTVAQLIDEVRNGGDEALRAQARRFDNVDEITLDVPRKLWREALETMDGRVRDGLHMAAHNIAAFHQAQMPASLEIEPRRGLILGRRIDPLERVAVYAPGGRAAYPSSVLMGVVPARVAGVGEVVVCSPAGEDGLPPASVLAACEIANADRLFAIGGAGAIAAVALGTQTVPRVDKVVGPGNAYVTEAKRQLNGVIAIDSPAGPSEVLIVADDSADAELIAYELFAQAEHDPDAACVLVSTSAELLANVAALLDSNLAAQERNEIIARSLASGGALLLANHVQEMLAFARDYAPEHLALYVREPRELLPSVRNAGTVFLGIASSVVFGDYITGANHVLPTATLARAYSGLSTADFLRATTYQHVSRAVAAEFAPVVSTLALAEGLPAHAAAARLRAGER